MSSDTIAAVATAVAAGEGSVYTLPSPAATAVATAAIVSEDMPPVSRFAAQLVEKPGQTIKSMWPPGGWRHSRNSSIKA